MGPIIVYPQFHTNMSNRSRKPASLAHGDNVTFIAIAEESPSDYVTDSPGMAL